MIIQGVPAGIPYDLVAGSEQYSFIAPDTINDPRIVAAIAHLFSKPKP